jgi:hypothetical protein
MANGTQRVDRREFLGGMALAAGTVGLLNSGCTPGTQNDLFILPHPEFGPGLQELDHGMGQSSRPVTCGARLPANDWLARA